MVAHARWGGTGARPAARGSAAFVRPGRTEPRRRRDALAIRARGSARGSPIARVPAPRLFAGYITMPPSTMWIAPVVKLLSSEAR